MHNDTPAIHTIYIMTHPTQLLALETSFILLASRIRIVTAWTAAAVLYPST